jgi:hypothetical protein
MNTLSRLAPHPTPVRLSSNSLHAAVRRVLRRPRSILRTSAGVVTAAVVAGLAPAAHGWPAEVALSRLLPEFVGDGSEGFVLEGVADLYLPFPARDGGPQRRRDRRRRRLGREQERHPEGLRRVRDRGGLSVAVRALDIVAAKRR